MDGCRRVDGQIVVTERDLSVNTVDLHKYVVDGVKKLHRSPSRRDHYHPEKERKSDLEANISFICARGGFSVVINSESGSGYSQILHHKERSCTSSSST